jgi:hypothetical protein
VVDRADILAGMGPTRSDIITTGRTTGSDRASILGGLPIGSPRSYNGMLDDALQKLSDQGLLTTPEPSFRFEVPDGGYPKGELLDIEKGKSRRSLYGRIGSSPGMTALRYGVSIPASTAMETMDLLTGQDVSAKDWFHQAFAEPIGWRQVREKHPNVYKWGSVPIQPLAPLFWVPATLDMAGWEGGADFAADMTFDLWNLTGGLGKFAGWSRGASGMADDLFEAAGKVGGREGVFAAGTAQQQAAEMASGIIRREKSISAGIRYLNKTPAGQEVMRTMGITPGIRFRVPGTGPATRWFGLDKLPGVGERVAKIRARQTPEFYKRSAGVTDEQLAAEILRQRRARKPFDSFRVKNKDAVVDPTDPLQTLGRTASKQPIELVLPGQKGRVGVAEVMDAPIRGRNAVRQRVGPENWDKAINMALPAMFASPYKFLDKLINSENPAVGFVGARIKEAGRNADWRSRDFNSELVERVQKALNEANVLKIGDGETLQELAYMDDIFIRGADGEVLGRRPQVATGELGELTDDELQKLFDVVKQVETYTREMQLSIRGKEFKASVDEILEAEGAYQPRLPTEEGYQMLGKDQNELPHGKIQYEGRFEASNLKDRKIRVGQAVDLIDPKTGQKVRVLDEVLDPRESGRSVVKQVNDAAAANGLPQVYETSFLSTWGRYGNIMGDDFRLRIIENEFAKMGLIIEDQGALNELAKIQSKVVNAEASISKSKAKLAEARRVAKDYDRKRRESWKGWARPRFANSQEGLDSAVKLEKAFNEKSALSAELEVIDAELDVVRAQIRDLPKDGPMNSVKNKQYLDAVERANVLAARVRAIEDMRNAIDEVVDTLQRMRALEQAGDPRTLTPEARVMSRARRGVTADDEAVPFEMYAELDDILAAQLDRIETQVLPSVRELAERFGFESNEAQQLQDLIAASRGELRTARNRKQKIDSRVKVFNDRIKEFTELDSELGYETQLASANPDIPLEQQLLIAQTNLERQNQWLQQQMAAVGGADEIVPTTTVVDLPTGPLELPTQLVSRRKRLGLEKTQLDQRKKEILVELEVKAEEINALYVRMDEQFAKAQRAIDAGDSQNVKREEALAMVAKHEYDAQALEFDELIPLYDDFQRTLDEIGEAVRSGKASSEEAGQQVAGAYETLEEGLDLLGAMPVRDTAEAIDDLQKVLLDDVDRWGNWRVMGNEDITAREVNDVLTSFQQINHRESVKGAIRTWNTFQRFLKSQQLATPGFVLRNTQGAFWNAWQMGVPPGDLVRSFRMLQHAKKVGNGDYQAGVRQLAGEGRKDYTTMLEMMDAGVMRSGQGATSVEQALVADVNLAVKIGRRKRGASKGEAYRYQLNPFKPEFAVNQGIRSANNMVEDAVRLGTGMHVRYEGGTIGEALELIARTQFDYNELSEGERWLKQFVFPFWTWTRKNLPLQLSMLWRRPGKMNRLITIKDNLDAMSEQERNVPAFYMEPFGMRLPFAPGGSRMYFVPDLPFVDAFKADFTTDEFLGRTILSDMTPALKAPLELALSKQFFKGLPISNRYQKIPVFGSVPGLNQALSALPYVREGKMRNNHLYAVEQFWPMFSRMRRIIPTEEKKQGDRHIQSMLSMGLGIPIRFNNRDAQRMARSQRDRDRAAARQDRRDLADADR